LHGEIDRVDFGPAHPFNERVLEVPIAVFEGEPILRPAIGLIRCITFVRTTGDLALDIIG